MTLAGKPDRKAISEIEDVSHSNNPLARSILLSAM